jgi:hypothetical protein
VPALATKHELQSFWASRVRRSGVKPHKILRTFMAGGFALQFALVLQNAIAETHVLSTVWNNSLQNASTFNFLP